MRIPWVILTGVLVLLAIGGAVWLSRLPGPDAPGEAVPDAGLQPPALRIGLIPERDIFAQRARYRALADYLAERLQRPVELVTNNTYEGVLEDFASKRVDAAFLGSLVAVLAMDRHDARVVLKPELPGGVTTYRGVILVRPDSAIERVENLSGRSIAMVKATTAGDLFPIFELARQGLLASAAPPEMVWVGTHDGVMDEVMAGRVEAGAAKDLRLQAYEAEHPERRFRRLAVSDPVPNNALVLREAVADELGPKLAAILLGMDADPAGRRTLTEFGAVRFVPCSAGEYEAIYAMVEELGERWSALGVSGPAPERKSAARGAD
ncbi:MAG: phosphate/phosphite/phosphonate ABC transporter substrate-binding protein [Planctomycetota bacterium]|nr:phosphate/phosphite/phosphonate ABC transporter substrate-binding protein [Planctomycetota bacterium]